MRCDVVERELSARMDGAVDQELPGALSSHLATCQRCRAFRDGSARIREMTRVRAAEPVPDLVPAIMAEVQRGASVRARWQRRDWGRAAVAFAAGLVTAAVVAGGLPGVRRTPPAALATEIPRGIAEGARDVTSYRASFHIVEFGFHPDVPRRTFTADIAFRAPERFRARITDRTAYPSDEWPRNDIALAVAGDRWFLDTPRGCPPEALPACAPEGRDVVSAMGRPPFDGQAVLPTDIVLPVRSLAGSERVRVRGETEVLGRPGVVVELAYRDASALFAFLHAGGMWRPILPHDRVLVTLEEGSWFPLAYEVRDETGRAVFRAEVRSLGRGPDSAWVPYLGTGRVRDFGFVDAPFASVVRGVPAPARTAGLDPYRAGRIGGHGAPITDAELGRVSLDEALAAAPYALLPVHLPPEYRLTASTVDASGVTFHFRRPGAELDGGGVRLFQAAGEPLPPPLEAEAGARSTSRGSFGWPSLWSRHEARRRDRRGVRGGRRRGSRPAPVPPRARRPGCARRSLPPSGRRGRGGAGLNLAGVDAGAAPRRVRTGGAGTARRSVRDRGPERGGLDGSMAGPGGPAASVGSDLPGAGGGRLDRSSVVCGVRAPGRPGHRHGTSRGHPWADVRSDARRRTGRDRGPRGAAGRGGVRGRRRARWGARGGGPGPDRESPGDRPPPVHADRPTHDGGQRGGEGAGSGALGRAGAGPGPRGDPGLPAWRRGPGPVPGQGGVRRVRGTAASRRHRGGASLMGQREHPDRPRAGSRGDPVPPTGDPSGAGGPGGPGGPEPRPPRRSRRLRWLLLPALHRTGSWHGPVAPLLGDRHRYQHLAGPHGTPADHRPPGGRGVRGPGLQVGRRVPDPGRNALRVRPVPLTVPSVRLS